MHPQGWSEVDIPRINPVRGPAVPPVGLKMTSYGDDEGFDHGLPRKACHHVMGDPAVLRQIGATTLTQLMATSRLAVGARADGSKSLGSRAPGIM